MYFDSVLTKDMVVLFNGTPSETKEWLENHETDVTVRVCDGKTLQFKSVDQYLDGKNKTAS